VIISKTQLSHFWFILASFLSFPTKFALFVSAEFFPPGFWIEFFTQTSWGW